MWQWMMVAAGGAAGATVRWGLQAWLIRVAPYFPWGTAIANVAGCLIAGSLMRFLPEMSPTYRHLILTGFLGALTTFSSFSIEVVSLLDQRRYAAGLAHWAGGAILCILAAVLGYWLAIKVFPPIAE